MLIAAQNVTAICAAQSCLVLAGIGFVASPAHAQSHDAIGPPTSFPVTANELNAPVDPKPASVALTDRETVEKAEPTRVDRRPEREERFLGAAPIAPSSVMGTGDNQQSDSNPTEGMGRSAWATAIVLGLIVASAMGVRAIAKRQGGLMASLGPGGRAPGGLLEVLGRFPIGRGQTLVLLKIDQRVLLLSQSAGSRLGAGAGMSTLCEISDPEEVASILIKSRDEGGDSMADRFRSMLAGQSSAAPLPRASTVGRRVFEGDVGDTAEFWDESQAVETLTDRAEEWPTETDSSALGSLRSRLEHWRDVEASA